MDLSLEREIVGTPDLRHQVRRLKWFRHAFHRCAELMAVRCGMSIAVDDRRLASAFLDWAETVETQKDYGRAAPRDFAAFASGLLLVDLLRGHVGTVAMLRWEGDRAPGRAAATVWPVGFLATSYCVSILNAIAAQDGFEPFRLSAEASDPRVWHSFRENVREEPSRAIGFLDLFVGNEPNWLQPGFAPARPGFRAALARQDAPRAIH